VLAAQRRRLILRTVRSDHGVQVVDLAQRFGVSEMTVRRDLSQLQREGKLTRVHGGAVSEAEEPPFAAIAIERRDAKERVGRAAADLVEDGRTIMIDIGTTTLELARALRGRELTVITTNLAVVEELMPDPRIELVLLGGAVRRNYRSLVGVLAEDALRQVSADIAFLGASGIRSEDLAVMDTTMVEVPIKRGMIASARRSILLVDAAKFAQGGVVRVCPIDELDGIVTDADASDPLVHRIQRAGVEVFPA
jgi:DeoR/GlpR family transcriptional regulator of sugar metabolism